MIKKSLIMKFIFLLIIPISHSLFPLRVSKINPVDRMKHLDLIWKIRAEIDECDVNKGDVCGSECLNCEGKGEIICKYCGGTGFLMLGNDLIGTNNDCPVCNGTGMNECKKCMGAGYIVKWRDDYSE